MTDRATQGVVINQVAGAIHATALDKGFWQPPDPFLAEIGAKLLLIVSEVAEAQDVIRDSYEGPVNPYTSMTDEQGAKFIEELADVVIRTLDMAQYFEHALPSIGDAILAKMAKNNGRPYRHGRRF